MLVIQNDYARLITTAHSVAFTTVTIVRINHQEANAAPTNTGHSTYITLKRAELSILTRRPPLAVVPIFSLPGEKVDVGIAVLEVARPPKVDVEIMAEKVEGEPKPPVELSTRMGSESEEWFDIVNREE